MKDKGNREAEFGKGEGELDYHFALFSRINLTRLQEFILIQNS